MASSWRTAICTRVGSPRVPPATSRSPSQAGRRSPSTRRRCAPPMQGTSMTLADSTSEPGPPPPAPRCGRTTTTSRPRSTTWPVTGPPPCTTTTNASRCPRRPTRPSFRASRRSGSLPSRPQADRCGRHSPATAISSTTGNGSAPGPSSGPRCATPLTSSTNSAITSWHRSYATPPTAPPKPASPARRRADHNSPIPIRHRGRRKALTRHRREEVLDITRKAIDRWLTATTTN